MIFEFDADANAIYLRLRDGRADETLEIEDGVYADVGEDGGLIGVEFVRADEFLPFLRRHAGHAEQVKLPRDVTAWTAIHSPA